MKKMLMAGVLALFASNTSAAVLTETWPDPLGGWRTRWVALNSNMQNYYVCAGDPNEDNRGNNPCGLWICDGVIGGNCDIIFDPLFGASISQFDIRVESFVPTTLTLYDMGNVAYAPIVLSTNGSCVPACGCTTLPYGLATPNGVSHFVMSSSSQVEGNTAIDDFSVTVDDATPVEPTTWGKIKGLYH